MDEADEAVFRTQRMHEKMMNHHNNNGNNNDNQNKERAKPGANNYSLKHNHLSSDGIHGITISSSIIGRSPTRFSFNRGNGNRRSSNSNNNSNTNNNHGNSNGNGNNAQMYAHPPNDGNYGYNNSHVIFMVCNYHLIQFVGIHLVLLQVCLIYPFTLLLCFFLCLQTTTIRIYKKFSEK